MSREGRQIPWLKIRDGIYYVFWNEGQRTKRLTLGTRDSLEAKARFAAFLTEGHAVVAHGNVGHLTVEQALSDYHREHVTKKVIDKRRAEYAIDHLRDAVHRLKNDLSEEREARSQAIYALQERIG